MSDVHPPASSATELKTAARGVAYLGATRILSMVISLASMAILARLLSTEDFGIVAIAYVVIGLPLAVYEGSFAYGLIQRRTIDDNDKRIAFWLAMGVATALVAALWLAAPLIAGLFKTPRLADVLPLIALGLPAKASGAISMALLQRQGRFGAVAFLLMLSNGIGNLVIAAPLAALGAGMWSLAAGSVLGFASEALVSYALARNPLKWPSSWSGSSEQARTSVFMTITQVLNWAALSAPSAATGRLLGAHAVGLYSRAWRFIDIVSGIAAAPMQRTLIPAFARLQDNKPEARAAFESAMATSVFLFAMTSGLVVVAAPAIVRLILGPKWDEAVLPVQILFAAFMPRATYKVTEAVSLGMGQAGRTAVRQAIYLVLMIGGPAFGARYGLPGLCIGVAGAITVFYAYCLVVAVDIVESRWPRMAVIHVRGLALAAVPSIAAIAALTIAESLGFWPRYVIAGAAGAAGVWALALVPGDWLGPDYVELRRSLGGAVRRGFDKVIRARRRPSAPS